MEKTMEDDQSEPWVLSSLMSELQNQSSQIIEKDLLVVLNIINFYGYFLIDTIWELAFKYFCSFHNQIHLLRLVCSLGGPLAGDLHKIVSELFQLGVNIIDIIELQEQLPAFYSDKWQIFSDCLWTCKGFGFRVIIFIS